MFWFGDANVGEGVNAVHHNLLLGPRDGPVGAAFCHGPTSPSRDCVPFFATLAPNVPVLPATLIVPKGHLVDAQHARMVWGAAGLGIAIGVHRARADGTLPADAARGWAVVASIWVQAGARDEDALYRASAQATWLAIRRALAGAPADAEIDAAAAAPRNSSYRPPAAVDVFEGMPPR